MRPLRVTVTAILTVCVMLALHDVHAGEEVRRSSSVHRAELAAPMATSACPAWPVKMPKDHCISEQHCGGFARPASRKEITTALDSSAGALALVRLGACLFNPKTGA